MSDPVDTTDPRLLAGAARYCSGRPEFLGYWLDLYRETEGLEAAALARHLGCEVEVLDQLALCLRPVPERRAQAMERLAARFGVDRKRLAAVLLQAEAYARAREISDAPSRAGAPAAEGSPVVFAAASDRVADAELPPDETPDEAGEPE
jgi:DNA-binding transcriptional regulator YdaS (Cro superfamily)